MEDKAEKIDLKELKDYIKMIPTTDELKLMQTDTMTSLDSYKREQQQFVSEFHKHVAIIERYDEILADKASKHSVYEIENKLKKKFKPVTKDLNTRIEANLDLI